jgi:hypothetical protein
MLGVTPAASRFFWLRRRARQPSRRGRPAPVARTQLSQGVRRIGPSTPRGLLLKSILFPVHFGSIALAAAEQSSISPRRSTRWHERTGVSVGHVRGGAVSDFLHCCGHAAGSCHERPSAASVIVPSLREGRAALGHCSGLWATSSARAQINGIAARATGLLLPWRVGTGKDIGRSFCPGALAPAAQPRIDEKCCWHISPAQNRLTPRSSRRGPASWRGRSEPHERHAGRSSLPPRLRRSRRPARRCEVGTGGPRRLSVCVRRIGPSIPRGLFAAAAEQSSISPSRSTRWHERTGVAVGHVPGGVVPDFLHCCGHAAGSCHEPPSAASVIVPSLREGRAALGHCSALWATSSARALIKRYRCESHEVASAVARRHG